MHHLRKLSPYRLGEKITRKMEKNLTADELGEVFKSMGYGIPTSSTEVQDGDYIPPTDGVAVKIYVVQVNYWPFHTALQVDVDSNNDGTFDDNEKLTYEVSNDDQGVAILLYNSYYPENKIKQRFEAMSLVDSPKGIFDTLQAAANAHRDRYDIVENNCRDVCRRAIEFLRTNYRDKTSQPQEAIDRLIEIARSAPDAVPKTAATILNIATKGAISKTFHFAIDKYGALAKVGFSAFNAKHALLFRVSVSGNPE